MFGKGLTQVEDFVKDMVGLFCKILPIDVTGS